MSKAPWFAMYPSNWLNGTAGMKLVEVGAYIQITMLLYDNDNSLELERIEHPITGKLTGYSYKALARRLNTRSDAMEKIVDSLIKQKKLSILGGYLTSHKVAKELHKREMISKRKREAAQQRWNLRAKNIKDIKDYR